MELIACLNRITIFLWICNIAVQARNEPLIDTNKECRVWAAAGECDANPGYMRKECAFSCRTFDDQKSELANKSFFDLEALDIDNKVVPFNTFEGKVTIVVNVASFCGYTKSHYEGLVKLYKDVKDTGMVEIMAFPCNQFGGQEPETCPVIKEFAQSRGVEFRMMDKIDVNGPETHLVYRFLKQNAGPRVIKWNFATYYVIAPDGTITSHSGVEPYELKDHVLDLVKTHGEL